MEADGPLPAGPPTEPGSRLREIAGSAAKVGIATVASLLGWVIGGKVLALELGAAGVGVFGLLRQLLQSLVLVSTFSGGNALVQGLASRSGPSRARFTHTVARLYALGGAAVAVVLLVAAPWLGPRLLPHPQAVTLLRWLSLAVLVSNAEAFFTGLLNGQRDIGALVRAQLLGPLAVLLLAFPAALLVRQGSPAGLVLLLVGPGAAVAAAALLRARRAGWFRPQAHPGVDRDDARAFARMSGVVLASGLLVTGTQYLQSRLVAEHLGLEQAGLFWVAWTISMTYVTILLGSYGTFYLPALSALTERGARHALVRDYLRLALLVMPVLVSLVVLLKPWVVLVMFSERLLPALGVMRWMLVGDLLKGVAWVLAIPMLAFGQLRWFFWTEVIFNLALAAAAAAGLQAGWGIEALGLLFTALYAAYLLTMLGFVRWVHGFRVTPRELGLFAWGLGVVLATSWATWSSERVEPWAAAGWLLLAGSFVGLPLAWRRWRPAPGGGAPP